MTAKIERVPPDQRIAMAEAIRDARYELVPTAGARDAATALPEGGTVTITASPRRGIEATVELSIYLRRHGFRVVPHMAARLVDDRSHLGEILARLIGAGVDELFVIGGDGPPRGGFHDSLGLLRAMGEGALQGFKVGIAGYPEGHPLITDAVLLEALIAKQGFASYVTTQVCFDAAAITSWIAGIRDRGIDLPVLIGVPGVVAVHRLLSVGARIGVGDSLRFLTRHRGLWRKLLRPDYSPTRLLVSLGPALADARLDVAGVHIYTFNQAAATAGWREEILADLES
ncbi:MAG: methylenetetrahydrofolate reductase [Actinobacteria bacterium]|nr:methylenetetrahydrofolate reductase [Actinomycetota bacterium]